MKIYFMGICGTAMGNVAVLCKEMGYDVTGSDSGIYPPMSALLKEKGITLLDGYDPLRLKALMPDLVVVGNAISRGNPEIEWLLESRTFNYTSLPEFLHSHLLNTRKNIVVTGTHGKTTTTTLIAYLLKENNVNPGYIIGGIPINFPKSISLGAATDPFVIEGDEYDSAFFDKRSKFIHYLPSILVINNLEFDHADIFRDLDDVKRTFNHLLRIVPNNGTIIINGDDPNIESLFPISWAKVIRVGVGENNDLKIINFKDSAEGSYFDLVWKNQLPLNIQWPQSGLYNARNLSVALLAVMQAMQLENLNEISLESLHEFKGVKRRQEVLYTTTSLTIIEDFAHHPSSVQEVLKSFRKKYPSHRIVACFEPRCNTMKTTVFQDKLSSAFQDANLVCLGPVFDKGKINQADKLNTTVLCEQISANQKNCTAKAFDSNPELLQFILEDYKANLGKKPQLYCFITNGSFDGIIPEFVQAVSK